MGTRRRYGAMGLQLAILAWSSVSRAVPAIGTSAPSATGLSATPVWTAESNFTESQFGSSVAGGDVNGDGYSDVIVGAPDFYDTQKGSGQVFLYLGSTSGKLTRADWLPEGDRGATLGISVATGDVNGDAYADVIVGGRGRAYLYLGSSSGLPLTPQWTAGNIQSDVSFGQVVSSAGDVNGDGYADVIIASPVSFGIGEGRVYLYLGSPSGLSSTPAQILKESQIGEGFGTSESAAGDVNGDGYGDVIVGAPDYSNGNGKCGRVYVYLGSSSGLSPLPWSADGSSDSQFGWSVSTAGDVNGDGYSDAIVGAPNGGPAHEGEVLLFKGSPSGLSSSPSIVIGEQEFARFGSSVATAGDVNGDGYSDVLSGSPVHASAEIKEGRAYLYLGSSSGLSPKSTWMIQGDQADALLGGSVDSPGDVNGDGYSDVLVGAPWYTSGQYREGKVFLYLGSATGPSPSPAWNAQGTQDGEDFGFFAASVGDVNGDGYSDVIIGAPNYDNGQGDRGRFFLYLGSSSGLSGAPDWNAPGFSGSMVGDINGDGYSDVIIGSYGTWFIYLGSPSGPGSGSPWTPEGGFPGVVSSAGDVNGDGYSDVVIGAPGPYDGPGRVFVYLGSSTGPSSTPDWIAAGRTSSFGSRVATAGDVNGDGYSDLIVGAPECCAFVYLGSPSGLSALPAWSVEGNALGDLVSSAGDVNGDGYSDVIVAPGGLRYSEFSTPFVYLGSKSGLSLVPAWTLDGLQYTVGFNSISPAGDVDGDGYSDLIVSEAEFSATHDTSLGKALLYLGSASGVSPIPVWKAEGSLNSIFGWVVSSAGDVNGDGYSDFLVGELGTQMVHGYVGNRGGKLSRSARQLRVADGGPVAPLGSSGATGAFRLAANVTPPAGARVGHLEWETGPVPGRGDGQGEVITGIGTDQNLSGDPATFDETIQVTGPGYFHWRVRLHTDDPRQPNTPWFSMPGDGMTETKVRVGDPTPPAMAPIGLGPKDLIYTDTPPMPFSWHSGEGNDQFELEWSSNPEFRDIRASAGIAAMPKSVGVYVPDPETWLRILQMGRYPDARQSPIFWRVSTDKNGAPNHAPTSGFWLAPVQGPTLVQPPDGETFLVEDPPKLIWSPNHNLDTWDSTSHGGFEIWFSAERSLRKAFVLGPGYSIKTSAWSPPPLPLALTDPDWLRIIEISCGTPDGRVYYAIFSQDAIGRRAWSQVQSLQITRKSTTCTSTPPAARASPRHKGNGRKHAPGWKWRSH